MCLTDEEHDALQKICSAFENVCVVLNVSNIIDLEWIDETCFEGHIRSVLVTWHGGQEGGRAAARLLCGLANPCGKLTDTIARHINFYPSTKNFGIQDDVVYEEDIYIGYRFFSTFATEQVRYPFGFGLSYTNFNVHVKNAHFENGKIQILVDVKNTGNLAGKEVVQVYAECPQGKLGKSKQVLAAFKKTGLLQANESEELNLEFELNDLASYDDSGVTGSEFCYVLEEGVYRIFVGTDVASAEKILVDDAEGISLKEKIVTRELSQAAAPSVSFERIHPKEENGKFSIQKEKCPTSKVDLASRIKESLPKEIPFTGDKGIRFSDFLSGKATKDDFIAQIDDEQLAAMVSPSRCRCRQGAAA